MKRLTAILYLFFFYALCVEAYDNSFYFSTLNLKDGLSQLSVLKIYQDKEGFMWFATRNGLNRYDGTTMKVYKHSSDNPNSLSNNHLKTITEDADGNIWVGAINGISRLEKRNEQITTYKGDSFEGMEAQSSIWINDIFFDRDNRLWVAGQGGLFYYQPETDSFKRFNPEALTGHTYFVTIFQDRQGNMLFGTTTGLFIFTHDLRFLKRYYQEDVQAPLTNSYINCIFEDTLGYYWVGTRENGLNKIDLKNNKVTRFTAQNSPIGNNHIRTIVSYNGQIVVGSWDGLILIDPETNEIQRYTNYEEKKGGLNHFSVYALFVDRSNTLWVGTYSGGISYYNPLNNRFQRLDPKRNAETSLGIYGAMDYQGEHTLWIASEGGGLVALDLQTKRFSNYLLDPQRKNMNDTNIFKSVRVEGDTVWCGTQRGTVYTFDTKTKKFSLFYNFNRNISIYKIERTQDGSIWMATTDNRAFIQFSAEGKRIGTIETDAPIASTRCFHELRENVFLIGTHLAGVLYYDKARGELIRFTTSLVPPYHFPNDYITAILPDTAGNIWIATHGGGLCLFDEKKGIQEHYTVKDGLADDNICAAVLGDDHKIWLSTAQGISSFDPETRRFYNYTDRNEIGANEFNIIGGIKLPNGDIYFSGSEEIISFNPERLISNKEAPPVVLTSLIVNNKEVIPGKESTLLKESVNYTDKIVLKANQNNLSVRYIALNYLYPYQNQYAYMLEGYDKEWNYVGNRHEAFYTNLKPGKYIFRVKASNNDGIWNEKGKSVLLHIQTPLWQTPYAIAFYILVTLAIAFSFYYYQSKKRELERDLADKQKEQERQEEFHQSKIRMFTNFSHELRTPLTLILSPLEEILQRVDLGGGLKNSLHLVYNNAQRLLLLVNQLMDLRKNQVGNMQLRISHDNLYPFIQEIYIAFNQIAERNRISFQLEAENTQIEGWFDRSLLEKVIFNLLSNAFKHTKPGELVGIEVGELIDTDLASVVPAAVKSSLNAAHTRFAYIKVKDTGEGISDEEKQHIFSPFYQGKNEQDPNIAGTGIGLSLVLSIVKLHKGVVWVEDNEQKGTVFQVFIPINQSAYSTEQIVEEKALTFQEERKNSVDWEPLKQRYQILLAEDNQEVRSYIKYRLENYFDIIEADNGVSALECITEKLPDMVISDIMMPQMDGLTLCTTIKQDLRTSHIPVIIITAKSMVMHIKEGFQCGADDYIVKPFNMDVLFYRIRAILETRERLKELYGKKFSLESIGIETASADDRFMKKFFEVIEKNITNPDLNVEFICQNIGMGRATFYRKLKAITNLSLVELIRNKRLEIAARLLAESKLTISEISYQVGFNSNTYFTTCFKEQYTVSPTEYIQMQKGNTMQ
ncbi:response regulator [Parabacteroides sp. OttesenSCG-928-K15]|nr:response regulator [Parabacteroides sp. OttesenSCG-928-K15]